MNPVRYRRPEPGHEHDAGVFSDAMAATLLELGLATAGAMSLLLSAVAIIYSLAVLTRRRTAHPANVLR
jgi:hypothetical protein